MCARVLTYIHLCIFMHTYTRTHIFNIMILIFVLYFSFTSYSWFKSLIKGIRNRRKIPFKELRITPSQNSKYQPLYIFQHIKNKLEVFTEISKNLIIIIIIIIIIMSCRLHGYPWPSLVTSPHRSSPLAGLQGYIPYPHIAAICMFELVVLLLLGHMRGSIGIHHLWARPCFSSSVLHVWFVWLG